MRGSPPTRKGGGSGCIILGVYMAFYLYCRRTTACKSEGSLPTPPQHINANDIVNTPDFAPSVAEADATLASFASADVESAFAAA